MALPQLVGHRGYPRHYPENTLIGIEAAIAAGARFVEVDVQISRDRVPVLFHDRDLQRICGVPGKIHDFNYAELWALRAAQTEKFGERFNDVHIPRLAELGHLLLRKADVTAFIELKRSSLERFGPEAMLNLVRRALKPAVAQCVLISYSLAAMLAARQAGWAEIGVVIDRWDERQQDLIAAIKPQYIFCDVAGLPPQGKLQLTDAQVAVFEITDPQLALALAARGVDLIETFEIGEMLRQLSRPAASF